MTPDNYFPTYSKSDSKSTSDTKSEDSLEDIFREARATAPSIVPFKKETEGKVRKKAAEELIPLSWTEQVTKPNVKVIEPSEPHTPPLRPVSFQLSLNLFSTTLWLPHVNYSTGSVRPLWNIVEVLGGGGGK